MARTQEDIARAIVIVHAERLTDENRRAARWMLGCVLGGLVLCLVILVSFAGSGSSLQETLSITGMSLAMFPGSALYLRNRRVVSQKRYARILDSATSRLDVEWTYDGSTIRAYRAHDKASIPPLTFRTKITTTDRRNAVPVARIVTT